MKNVAFYSLLRWKMITLPILTTVTYTLLFQRSEECTFQLWNVQFMPKPTSPRARSADSHAGSYRQCNRRTFPNTAIRGVSWISPAAAARRWWLPWTRPTWHSPSRGAWSANRSTSSSGVTWAAKFPDWTLPRSRPRRPCSAPVAGDWPAASVPLILHQDGGTRRERPDRFLWKRRRRTSCTGRRSSVPGATPRETMRRRSGAPSQRSHPSPSESGTAPTCGAGTNEFTWVQSNLCCCENLQFLWMVFLGSLRNILDAKAQQSLSVDILDDIAAKRRAKQPSVFLTQENSPYARLCPFAILSAAVNAYPSRYRQLHSTASDYVTDKPPDHFSSTIFGLCYPESVKAIAFRRRLATENETDQVAC